MLPYRDLAAFPEFFFLLFLSAYVRNGCEGETRRVRKIQKPQQEASSGKFRHKAAFFV